MTKQAAPNDAIHLLIEDVESPVQRSFIHLSNGKSQQNQYALVKENFPLHSVWPRGVGLPVGSGGIVAARAAAYLCPAVCSQTAGSHEEGWHRGDQLPLSTQ